MIIGRLETFFFDVLKNLWDSGPKWPLWASRRISESFIVQNQKTLNHLSKIIFPPPKQLSPNSLIQIYNEGLNVPFSVLNESENLWGN